MKKKQIILLIILLTITTGCFNKVYDSDDEDSINYNLTIEDIYSEKIYINLNEEDFKEENYESFGTLLVNENFYPIFSNYNKIYDKEINEDKTKATLSYDYTSEEFIKDNLIMTCFEDYEIVDNDKYTYIKLSGDFYCSYGKNVNIYVTSSYKVDTCNGDKKGSSYYWSINNTNDVDIEYKVLKQKNNIIIYIVGGSTLILGSIGFVYYKKKKKTKMNNYVNY